MMREIRKHLSYANVMATIAMVLALGGATALAAGHLKKNTVTSKSIKNGAVKTADLKGSAVTGAKIADGAVGIGDADKSLHLQCPGGTQYLQGACIRNDPNGTANWTNAQLDCQNQGGRLPNVSELMTLAKRGVVFGAREFTDVISISGSTLLSETVFSGGNFIQLEPTANPTQYRCVFDPTG